MVAEKSIHTAERNYERIEIPETETPLDLAEDVLMVSILPSQVAALEHIAECLEEGNWNEAFETGLIGAMGSLGTHLDHAHSLSLGGQLEEKISKATSQYRDTTLSIETAMRIMESRSHYTEEEAETATRIASMEMKNLVLRLEQLDAPRA